MSPTFHLEFPPELPISARAAEIIAAIRAHPVVILAGETGSGKTTQIPKLCLAAGRGRHGMIACTQPRRVAALSLSRRVAEEMRVPWGREVGCKVRFSDHTTPATVVKFMTDGLLLAEAQGDPRLGAYDTIVIDEAHERSLNIDFLLGHLRSLRELRPELRIIITSATIDLGAFSAAFGDAPVIRVEGRAFPVEVVYAPLDGRGGEAGEGEEGQEEVGAEQAGERKNEGGKDGAGRDGGARAEALHYVDGAVAATERLVRSGGPGDVLVFMPSERDIRETCDLLGGRLRDCEIIPLFGRLSNADQHRIFGGSRRRKVVVATNLAETSLTIPGIRFVVDTGLARISRYSPSARTRRLPIEPVAQASADQRKGRCGRVAAGVCVRLYSEDDYLSRPRFAQPEIQRANLADVILRLQAGGLGEVERFPFISPPAPKAIRAGYALLEELGAIEPPEAGPEGGRRRLTTLGRELARLPVDPTVARMILQARAEKAVREVLVIAAGLSIQDPRERPLAQRAAADAAHRRFAHPDSDFLGLLNLWAAFHAAGESMSQSRLRAFCRAHFLSYPRMREWRDVHVQLLEVLRAREDFAATSVFDGLRPEAGRTLAFGTPGYRAIHRSILSGLLGSIAQRDEERGGYRATHDRQVALFPGSVLAQRVERPARSGGGGGARPAGPKGEGAGPRWILAAEIVETARLYARTCARLDPAWAVELGAHVARVAHSEPFWDAESGRVRVVRRTRLYGLELERRAVSFGPIDPVAATEIFIREGLVNDTIVWPFAFLEANRRVRARVETLLTRARDRAYLNLDEALYRFYAARLTGISAVAELVDLVRQREAEDPDFLRLAPSDLRDPAAFEVAAADFPEALPLENRAVPLHYAYKPGQDDDGATVEVNVRELGALTPVAIDWAVAGHLPAKVEHYLRALPKEQRRRLTPLAEHAQALAEAVAARDRLTGRRESLAEALAVELRERHRIDVAASFWSAHPPPDHLRVRIRVRDDAGAELAVGRDLAAVAAALAAKERETGAAMAREDPAIWIAARRTWERPEQTTWTFGDVPERVPLAERSGVEVWAYPGLRRGAAGVALRLFSTLEEARAATAEGWPALLALELGRELAGLHRDLRLAGDLGALAATLGPVEPLRDAGFQSIRAWLLGEVPAALTAAAFAASRQRARAELPGLAERAQALWRSVLALRQDLLVEPQAYPGLAQDLAALLPPDFLGTIPYAQLTHVPRYLRAMKLRCERWRRDPAKDADRARQWAPLAAAAAAQGGTVRWLAEEFRVSLFAQELGTPVPVSAVKLERWLRGEDTPDLPAARTGARTALKAAADPAPPAAAAGPAMGSPAGTIRVVAAPQAKGGGRLKSLGALDRVFPRPGG